MKFTIEKGTGRPRTAVETMPPTTMPIGEMEVGDSFVVEVPVDFEAIGEASLQWSYSRIKKRRGMGWGVDHKPEQRGDKEWRIWVLQKIVRLALDVTRKQIEVDGTLTVTRESDRVRVTLSPKRTPRK